MPMLSDEKDPTSVEDFIFDWTRELASSGNDTIAQSSWTATVVTVEQSSVSGAQTTVRLSGGTVGKVAMVTNKVTLTSGQIKKRTLALTIGVQ